MWKRTSTHNVENAPSTLSTCICVKTENRFLPVAPMNGEKRIKRCIQHFGIVITVCWRQSHHPIKLFRKNNNNSWEYTDNPADKEYMDLMGITTYTGYGGGNGEAGKHKVFPLMNWSASVLEGIPHFSTNNWGQGFIVARSGNYVYRLL